MLGNQGTIAHALEKTKYEDSDVKWKELDPKYHFSCQFMADKIAMNESDFIITSTYQEIAGRLDVILKENIKNDILSFYYLEIGILSGRLKKFTYIVYKAVPISKLTEKRKLINKEEKSIEVCNILSSESSCLQQR